jgi:hypothetical protein
MAAKTVSALASDVSNAADGVCLALLASRLTEAGRHKKTAG